MKRHVFSFCALIFGLILLTGCTVNTYRQRGHDVDKEFTTITVKNTSSFTIWAARGYPGDDIFGLDFVELFPDSTTDLSQIVLREKRRVRSVIFVQWAEEEFSTDSRIITIPVERMTQYSFPKTIVVDNATLFGKVMASCVIQNDTDVKLKITTSQGQIFSLAPNTYHVVHLMPIRTTVSWRQENWPLDWPKKSTVVRPDQCPSVFFAGEWYDSHVRIYDPGRSYNSWRY